MAKKIENIYQLHISLLYLEPKIWRRFLVTEDTTLEKLHKIIQEVMGWQDYHLHEFMIDGERYGMIEEGFDDDTKNEKEFKLSDLNLAEKQKFGYMYDFGDDWMHELEVEEILLFDKSIKYPKCLDGELACPPEDCGGFPGYMELKAISKTPEDELEDWDLERLEWLDDYDFDHFNTKHMNAVLRKHFAK